jgi:hypothetical protein
MYFRKKGKWEHKLYRFYSYEMEYKLEKDAHAQSAYFWVYIYFYSYRPIFHKDHIKGGDCSGGHHVGGENHNSLLLLIPGLSLDIFFIPLFSHKHTQMWILLKLIFILFNWNIKLQYTSSYLTCIWNLKFINMGRLGLHITYNLRTESGLIKYRRGPMAHTLLVLHASCTIIYTHTHTQRTWDQPPEEKQWLSQFWILVRIAPWQLLAHQCH